mgnify:CR=1 FL=1
MNMRKAMLLKLGSLQFSLWELHLYLDTHPMDAAAEARYMGYKKAYDEVRAEFTKKYGPLNPSEGNGEKWLKPLTMLRILNQCVK